MPDNYYSEVNENGVVTPLRDLAAFPRSEQAVLGATNLFNYDAWKGTGVHNGTAVYENNGVTVTSTSNDCYTEFDSNLFPVEARIPVKAGATYKLTWESDETEAKGRAFVFGNASTTSMANADNNVGKLEYTPAEGVTFVTMRFGVNTSNNTIHYKNIMFGLASVPDNTYAPYAMTNRELTEKVALNKSEVTNIAASATVDTEVGNELYKQGNMVSLNIALTGVTETEYTTLFRIPEGYRPNKYIKTRINNKVFQISSGGNCVCQSALSNENVELNLTWVTP